MDDGHFFIGLFFVFIVGIIMACFSGDECNNKVEEKNKDDFWNAPIVVPHDNGQMDCYVIPMGY